MCEAAIARAETDAKLPTRVLHSISLRESGRRDPETGRARPWPWTINYEGTGRYFASKAEAIAAVQEIQAIGGQSIDVGCMQVNLMHHPAAFPNLDRAFEPAVNADYAARFLVRLFGQTGDWTKATARYHSANPAQGEPYAGKVASFWPEEQRKAGSMPPPIPPGRVSAFAGPIPPFPTPRPRRVLPLHGMFAGAAPPPPSAIPSQPIQSFAGGIPAPNPGRGLDFYRATPIRFAMPFRLVVGLPPRLFR